MNKFQSKLAVSAGHEITLEIAKEILKAGGNAFDAAVSAYLAMFITEPCMASAGGGGFALCQAKGKKPEMLDFFVQTPGRNTLDRPIDRDAIHVDFGDTQETFYVGLATAAVPGTIAGIFSLHERYASLPFKELVAPVLDLCRSGVEINEFQAYDLGLLESIIRLDPSMREVFYNENGLLQLGDRLFMPQLPDFLQFLIDEGRRGFYEGEIARQIEADSLDRGGFLRRSDMVAYRSQWLDPMIIHRYGKNIVLPNGPSLGGAIIALLYKYRERNNGEWASSIYDIKHKYKHPFDLSKRLEELHPELGFHVESPSVARKGTSHFNILDKEGNAVSLTTTIGEGCGYFIPGTDMQMNNVLGEPFLLPYGLDSWLTEMRLNSMMTPVMITDDQGVSLVTGSGGASRIPFVIAQVIANIYEEGMDLDAATEKGRINVQDETVHVEAGNENYSTIRDLNELHWKGLNLYFGGVHSIYRNDQGEVSAVGDSRRFGRGEVFD
jgi:gamma-glutamyltranspeptidase/glutathione hydrolase